MPINLSKWFGAKTLNRITVCYVSVISSHTLIYFVGFGQSHDELTFSLHAIIYAEFLTSSQMTHLTVKEQSILLEYHNNCCTHPKRQHPL